MNILEIVISIFIFIEILNVMTLYYRPESSVGNGLGVFNAFHKSMKDEEVFPLVSYLVNWVAGAKLIFIMIGIVVVIFGNEMTQIFTVVALIISILSFYYRLFPIIKKLDKKNEITPVGYSKTLHYMIFTFIAAFTLVLVIYLTL